MSLINQLPVRIFDTAGRPVPAAQAWFYLDGTTDLQEVYADLAQTTPRTNPVIADNDGLLPPIYLNDSVLYRVLITGSDGDTNSPIYEASGVGGSSRPTSPVDEEAGSSYVVTLGDAGRTKQRNHTANMTTTLPSAVTAGNGFFVTLWNITTAYINTVSVSGGGTINGAASFVLHPGLRTVFQSNGSTWNAVNPARTTGAQMIPVPAGALIPRTSNGPTYVKVERVTNKVNFDAYAFGGAAQDYVDYQVRLPNSWDGQPIGVIIGWSDDLSGIAGETVTWGAAGRIHTDGTPMDAAYGTASEQADALIESGRYCETALFSFTPSDDAPGGGLLQMTIYRKAPAGGTMTVDAWLIHVMLFVGVTGATDA